MSEIVLVVEHAPERCLIARALGKSILAEADTEAELRLAVWNAVHCHCDEGMSPKIMLV